MHYRERDEQYSNQSNNYMKESPIDDAISYNDTKCKFDPLVDLNHGECRDRDISFLFFIFS
jgi:hypothetical protein